MRQNGPPRARVPVGRPRPQQAQQLQDDFQTPTIDQEEKDAFFNNLRTTIRQRDRPAQERIEMGSFLDWLTLFPYL